MLSEIILLMLVCLEHFISNTMKYTSTYEAYSICSAVGCSRIFAVPRRCKHGAEPRGPGAALGQHRVVLLWLSPLKGVPLSPGHQREEEALGLLPKWCREVRFHAPNLPSPAAQDNEKK